ncbi:MAG TPA: hypothetical protein VFG14_12390, partial [Chthoniobacteraceae bacterium]|nr:hypothetical protein [Chthoniobacteraceae bacterium]
MPLALICPPWTTVMFARLVPSAVSLGEGMIVTTPGVNNSDRQAGRNPGALNTQWFNPAVPIEATPNTESLWKTFVSSPVCS